VIGFQLANVSVADRSHRATVLGRVKGLHLAPRLCAAEKADYFFGSDLFGHNVRRVRPLAMAEAIADADWT